MSPEEKARAVELGLLRVDPFAFAAALADAAPSEPNDGPGPDGHHIVTGECFACLVGVATGPESHGDRCQYRHTIPCPTEREDH